jgi:Histidine kinase-, DNA gyrase B-, and HSP90-like ATPase/His Kinase A (phospho-acceptor) domain
MLLIILISGGCAIGVSLVGLLALRLESGGSVRLKLFTVTMATVLAMAAGVLGTAQAMFISQEDFGVVLVVCVAAGIASLGMAIPLARSVTADSRALRDALRGLGDEAQDYHDYGASDGVPAQALRHGFDASNGAGALGKSARHARPSGSGGLIAAGLLSGMGMAPGGGPNEPTMAVGRAPALATAELEDLRRERERALEQSRRELVAWVSHDLRTPLAGLRAMAEALEDGVASDPLRYHMQMRLAVDRLAGMVDDLFEMSRIHAGALRLSLSRVPLSDLVDEAVVGADALARARGVALSAEVNTLLAVRVDPREISRALTNLVANAIRHTPSDGAVRVEADERDGHAVLSVTDACGGIPADDLDRVFDVAWRGTAARTPEPLAGAGLGLAIVRGIVEAHSGEVDVHNVSGGCRFEVRLPVPAV